jgi:hypothetical protein
MDERQDWPTPRVPGRLASDVFMTSNEAKASRVGAPDVSLGSSDGFPAWVSLTVWSQQRVATVYVLSTKELMR